MFKNNLNGDHIVRIDAKNNNKLVAMEQGLYVQVVLICQNNLKITEENQNKMEQNSSSKISLKDYSIGLVFILIGLKK